MNQIAYLVYGNIADIIAEARFSILSAIYHSSKKGNISIVVVTDTPEKFSDLPIKTERIEKHELTEWYGPDKYNHRSKPKSLLKIINKADKTALIDTDTVFKKDPEKLFEKIKKGQLLVDKVEGEWSKTPQAYYDSCYPFLSSSYGINDNLRHVNSGIIGLTRTDKNVVQDTVTIIDEIYIMSGKLFHTEQFALAVAAKTNKLHVVDHENIIHHYWSRKRIHRAVAKSFMNNQTDLLSDAAKQQFLNLNFSVPRPPWYYRTYLKFRSKALKNIPQLRQFYIELGKALYSYGNNFDAIQSEMIHSALENLKERNNALYNDLLANDIQTIIKSNLLSKTSTLRINEIIKTYR